VWSYALVVIIVLVALLIIADALATYADVPALDAVGRHSDVTGEDSPASRLMFAVDIAAGAALVLGLALLVKARLASPACIAGAAILGIALPAIAVLDLERDADGAARWYVLGLAVLLGAALLLAGGAWRAPRARWLVLTGIVLLLSNPLTEAVERRLISDSDNYTFVAPDQPYRFDADASAELWLVTHVQELSETAAGLCLLAGFIVLGSVLVMRSNAGRSESGASTSSAMGTSR
jgi:hypothetical protein